jgi:hypothetical protein
METLSLLPDNGADVALILLERAVRNTTRTARDGGIPVPGISGHGRGAASSLKTF